MVYTTGEIVTSDIADRGVSLAKRVIEVTQSYLERRGVIKSSQLNEGVQ